MARNDFVLTGFRSLDRMLNALGSERAREINQKAMREAMKLVLAEAKATIPVRSGNLRRHLAVRVLPRKKGRIGIKVEQKEGAYKGDAYYGSFIELGWKTAASRKISKAEFGLRNGRRTAWISRRVQQAKSRHVPAKWYMRDAATRREQDALGIYYRGLQEMIEEEAANSGND